MNIFVIVKLSAFVESFLHTLIVFVMIVFVEFTILNQMLNRIYRMLQKDQLMTMQYLFSRTRSRHIQANTMLKTSFVDSHFWSHEMKTQLIWVCDENEQSRKLGLIVARLPMSVWERANVALIRMITWDVSRVAVSCWISLHCWYRGFLIIIDNDSSFVRMRRRTLGSRKSEASSAYVFVLTLVRSYSLSRCSCHCIIVFVSQC